MFHTRNAVPLAFALLGLTLAAPSLAATAKPAPAKKATAVKAPAGDGSVTRAQMQAEIKQAFVRADTNHDGFMSRPEFAARMAIVVSHVPKGMPTPTKEQVQRMLDAANAAFNDTDTNHDGKLSLAEASARPLKAFDAMDANHDGVLTLAEKRAAHEAAEAQGASGPVGPSVGQPSGPGR